MSAPIPWSSRLPWDDPAFSERMLAEHLNQEHGAASRRRGDIDAHVIWLHEEILGGAPSRVLDLGCGPGLYTARLAALGHSCAGIDFSPAAIAHAGSEAARTGADCVYHQEDLRRADLGSGFDLVTFLFGDLDTFAPVDAADLLRRAAGALAPGGRLVLEVHTRPAVERIGTAASSAARLDSGLFSAEPHTLEERSWWDPIGGIAMSRYRIVFVCPGRDVEEHIITTQARGREWYAEALRAAGLGFPRRYGSFGEVTDADFEVLVSAGP